MAGIKLCTPIRNSETHLDDQIVASHVGVYCIQHLQKSHCGIMYVDDPGKTTGFVLGHGKSNAECLNSLFEMCRELVAYTKNGTKRVDDFIQAFLVTCCMSVVGRLMTK